MILASRLWKYPSICIIHKQTLPRNKYILTTIHMWHLAVNTCKCSAIGGTPAFPSTELGVFELSVIRTHDPLNLRSLHR